MILDHARRRQLVHTAAALFAATALLTGSAEAAPGELDPSFGSGGIAPLADAQGYEAVTAVAPMTDGRVVVGATTSGGGQASVRIRRRLPDGSPDPTFDGDGLLTINPALLTELVGLQVLPDGRIVVALRLRADFYSGGEFVIARIKAAGGTGSANSTFDTTFGGGDGQFVVDRPDSDNPEALAMLRDGRLLLATHNGANASVWRIKADGSGLDNSFDTDGLAGLDTPLFGEIAAIAAMYDGRILVGGTAGSAASVARLKAQGGSGEMNGALDKSFGGNGVAEFSAATQTGIVDVRPLPDGRVVALGRVGSKAFVSRLRANGELDPSFNHGVRADLSGVATISPYQLAVQPDGRILAAVTRSDTDGVHPGVYRLDDGGLDLSWGGDGYVELPGTASYGQAVNHLPDTRVLVGGGQYTAAYVARLLGDDPALPAATPTPVPNPSSTASVRRAKPRIHITAKPRRRVRSRRRRVRVRFRFRADQVATFQCRMDRKRFRTCRSPVAFVVRRGRHRFQVRARNVGGVGPVVSVAFRVTR